MEFLVHKLLLDNQSYRENIGTSGRYDKGLPIIMTNNHAMSRSIYVPATSEWGDWVSGGLTERGSAIISDFALKWLEIHPKLRSQLLIFYIIILELLLKF